jgi:hypothetical protein
VKKTMMIVFFLPLLGQGQMSNTWLLGSDPLGLKAKIIFDSTSYNLISPDTRIMTFSGTEATISDKNGNFLMSSNGVWIADSTGNVMMNGDSLNPGAETTAYHDGLLLPYANIILPYPNDSTKYILFHHTCDWDGYSYPAYEVFYSVIDMTLNGGLGGVDSTQKNIVAFQDTIEWGLAACRHANGRDWWVVARKHNTDSIFKILFTPTGIASITKQKLSVPNIWYDVTQPTFSMDGNHFAYHVNVVDSDTTYFDTYALLFDFDRCSGMFSNSRAIHITTLTQSGLWGLAFSPSGEKLYTCNSGKVYQVNTNTLSVDTVAAYDGFCYPNPPWCTTFFYMYLAPNGKIYITSGSSVQYIHEMNYPDSAGVACDLQQHAINLGVFNFRAVPNHPNYYLGCDTTQTTCPCLTTGINEIEQHDFKFSISPNPSNGNFKIMYLLPQNSKGTFEVFDISGKKVFNYNLPQWSTIQNFDLSFLANGIYHCSIKSGNYYVQKKLAIIRF